MSLSLIPPNALVGLITFGRMVHLIDIKFIWYIFCCVPTGAIA